MMHIRDARETDLPAIVDIFNATVGTRMATAILEPESVEDRREWFRAHTPDQHPIWVLEEKGQIAGWLSLQSFLPRCAYGGTVEVSVYTHGNFRRQGVASRLLQEAIERGAALGISALLGHIFAHNEPSLRLFERMGFERWGLLPRVARLDGVERDLVIVGRHVASA
jgi:phosphinothricin acetyltransferase